MEGPLSDAGAGPHGGSGSITWRLHLRVSPETVFDAIASDEGRARFWSESAARRGNAIEFVFPDGARHRGRVLEELRRPRDECRLGIGTDGTEGCRGFRRGSSQSRSGSNMVRGIRRQLTVLCSECACGPSRKVTPTERILTL
jgi:hypothetical protein